VPGFTPVHIIFLHSKSIKWERKIQKKETGMEERKGRSWNRGNYRNLTL
jgi:hypothetical protein